MFDTNLQGRRPVSSVSTFSSNIYENDDWRPNNHRIDKKANDDKTEDEKEKKFSVAEYMIGTTGFQGPGKMWQAPYKLLKLLWLLAFIGCLCVMVVQLVGLFKEYFSFPTKTQIKLGFNPLALPAITFCNANPIRLSYAANLSCEVQHLLKLPDGYTSPRCENVNVSIDYDNGEYESDCFGCDEYYSEAEGLDEYFLRRQQIRMALANEDRYTRMAAGHQIEDMIVDCSLFGHLCSFDNVTGFYSQDYGNCYTYSVPNVKATKSGPETALDVTLNLETEEFLSSFKTAYGLRVVLHEQGTRAFPSSEGFIVSSGMETNIGIRLTSIQRKGGRYGNCDEGADVQSFFGFKYTIKSCRDLCLQRQFIQQCKCQPLEDEIEFREIVSAVKYCTTKEENKCVSKVYDKYYNVTDAGGDLCTCNNPCSETVYNPTISTRVWPVLSYVKTLEEQVCRHNPDSPKCYYAAQDYTVDSADARRSSFARIRLYYERLNYEIVEESPSYDSERFLSDIGGTLGLWIGASVLGLAELLELFILLCIHCCKR